MAIAPFCASRERADLSSPQASAPSSSRAKPRYSRRASRLEESNEPAVEHRVVPLARRTLWHRLRRASGAGPASGAAESFEDLAISREARQKSIAEAERTYLATVTALLGDPALADVVPAAVEDWNAMRARHDRLSAELGEDAPAVRELSDEIERKRLEIETALFRGGGLAGQMIGQAEQERWITFMLARADASWLEGQLPAYHAAPALYRERERMQVLIDGLKRHNCNPAFFAQRGQYRRRGSIRYQEAALRPCR